MGEAGAGHKGSAHGCASASRLFRSGDGETYRLDRLTLTFKHDSGREPCGYSVCTAVADPGWPGARLHRHGYEEWHIQLRGTGDCQLGDDRFLLAPGDMVYVPSGAAHGFRPAATGGSQLLISSPPGIFEGFVADVVAAQSRPATPDIGRDIQSIAEKYGIEFLTRPGPEPPGEWFGPAARAVLR